MHGIATQNIQLPKSKVFLLLPRLDCKQQVLKYKRQNCQKWPILGCIGLSRDCHAVKLKNYF